MPHYTKEFKDVYTIEHYSQDMWQVFRTATGLTEAINIFRSLVLREQGEFRLTTPSEH